MTGGSLSGGNPPELGRLYGASVFDVLLATDDISYRMWRFGRWDSTMRRFQDGLHHDLTAGLAVAQVAREQATSLGLAFRRLGPRESAHALNEFDRVVRTSVAHGITSSARRHEQRFSTCGHVRADHPPWELDSDDERPIGPDDVGNLDSWLDAKTAYDVGLHYELLLHSAASSLVRLHVELDTTNRTVKLRSSVPKPQGSLQPQLTIELVHIKNLLMKMDACTRRIHRMNGSEAAEVFIAFYDRNERRLDERLHDAASRLGAPGAEECVDLNCPLHQPGPF